MRNFDANWKLLRILKCKVTDYSNKNGYTGDQQGHIVDKKVILWINGVILSILRVVDKQGNIVYQQGHIFGSAELYAHNSSNGFLG